MSREVLNLGILERPCWTTEERLERRVALEIYAIGYYLYYDLEGDEHAHRIRLEYDGGMPRTLWAPDGLEVPLDRADVLIGEWYGQSAVVLDPEWFWSLPIFHDSLGGRCDACREMRKKQGLGS